MKDHIAVIFASVIIAITVAFVVHVRARVDLATRSLSSGEIQLPEAKSAPARSDAVARVG